VALSWGMAKQPLGQSWLLVPQREFWTKQTWNTNGMFKFNIGIAFSHCFMSSLIDHCTSFLIFNHFVIKRDEFFCPTLPDNLLTLITA